MDSLGGKKPMWINGALDAASVRDDHPLRNTIARYRDTTTPIARLNLSLNGKGIDSLPDPRTKVVLETGAVPPPKVVAESMISHRDEIGPVLCTLPFAEFDNDENDELSYATLVNNLRLGRELGKPIIMGGPALALDPEIMLRFRQEIGPLFDGAVAVIGEADLIIPELVRMTPEQLMRDNRLLRVKDGELLPGQHIFLTKKELKALPPIEYEYHYGVSHAILEGGSRGCSGTCKFCSMPKLAGGPRNLGQFTPKQYVTSLRSALYAGRFNLYLCDSDILNVGFGWWEKVRQMIDEDPILREHAKYISMAVYTNASRLNFFTPERLDLLKDLGFTRLIVGVQSAWNDFLKSVNRSSWEVQHLMGLVKECSKRGMSVGADMILGMPGFDASENLDAELSMMMLLALCGVGIDLRFYDDWRGSEFHSKGLKRCDFTDEDIVVISKISTLLSFLKDYRMRTLDAANIEAFSPLKIKMPLRRWDGPGEVQDAISDVTLILGSFIEHDKTVGAICREDFERFKKTASQVMSLESAAAVITNNMFFMHSGILEAMENPELTDNLKTNLSHDFHVWRRAGL
jgi:hypothetical protein